MIKKVRFPDSTEQDIQDSRIDGIANTTTVSIDSTPTSGSGNLVTSGGVKTAVDAKQDTLVSGTNVKTVNNQSLLGSGNITIEGGSSVQSDWEEDDTTDPAYIQNKPDDLVHYDYVGSTPQVTVPSFEIADNKVTSLSSSSTDTQYPSAKCAYDAINPSVATSQPSGGMLPNIFYRLGTLSGNTTFTLATPVDSNIANHYFWSFETGSTAPTITWPSSIASWVGGSAPGINASKHYEISVLDGIAVCMEV